VLQLPVRPDPNGAPGRVTSLVESPAIFVPSSILPCGNILSQVEVRRWPASPVRRRTIQSTRDDRITNAAREQCVLGSSTRCLHPTDGLTQRAILQRRLILMLRLSALKELNSAHATVVSIAPASASGKHCPEVFLVCLRRDPPPILESDPRTEKKEEEETVLKKREKKTSGKNERFLLIISEATYTISRRIVRLFAPPSNPAGS
jgi:hypothetical protein